MAECMPYTHNESPLNCKKLQYFIILLVSLKTNELHKFNFKSKRMDIKMYFSNKVFKSGSKIFLT